MKSSPRQLLLELLANPSKELRQSIKEPRFKFCFDDGSPRIYSLSEHVEAHISTSREEILLAMPTSQKSLCEIKQRILSISRINASHLSKHELLDKSIWYASKSQCRNIPLSMEHLPQGNTLAEELLLGCNATFLLRQLEQMQEEFSRLNFSHNNLKPRNIILSKEGRLIAIRCYHARFDGASREDLASFKALKRLIMEADTKSDIEPRYKPATTSQPEIMGPEVEGLILVREKNLYGYADSRLKIVIKPQFLWAESFREGRAEVETQSGMGLINKQGEFLIEPIYQIVDYDDMEGVAHIKYGEAWAMTDYFGNRISEFAPTRKER